MNAFPQRKADGIEVRQQARSRHRENQAQRGGAAGEHDALGQHLPDQAAAARSHRDPDGHFLLPCRGPREQQIRKIRADDQHHDPDSAGEHKESRAKTPADVIFEKARLESQLTAVMPHPDRFAQNVELGLCLLHGDSGFQTSDHRQGIPLPVYFRREGKRKEQIDPAARGEHRAEIEGGGHDADHRERPVIQRELSAHDARIGCKAPLPQAVAQQDYADRSSGILPPVNDLPSCG